MEKSKLVETLDSWLADDGPVAWTTKDILRSAEDAGAPVFPPTFMAPQEKQADWDPYLIDRVGASNMCMIDTPASHANRMEDIFLNPDGRSLVPQHAVEVTPAHIVPFVTTPQRVADAVILYSGWQEDVEAAIYKYADGDVEPLARLAPLSLVFGFFDGRGTGVRSQRMLQASIRAYNVDEQNARGQYTPPVEYIGLGMIEDVDEDDKKAKKAFSEMGLLSCPTHKDETRGGVIVHGEIVRRTIANLVVLRTFRAATEEKTTLLRRYLLGLALVAATYPLDYNLRQGCLLRKIGGTQAVVPRVGEDTPIDIQAAEALVYAKAAAEAWGVAPGQTRLFDRAKLSTDLKKTPKQRKKERAARRNKKGA